MNPFTQTSGQQKKNQNIGDPNNNNMASMNRESNSPTPQRNGNKIMVSGGMKIPV